MGGYIKNHNLLMYGILAEYVRAIISAEIDKSRKEAHRVLCKLLDFETSPLFTQNRLALDTEERRWFHAYSQSHDTHGDRTTPIVLRHSFTDGRRDIAVHALPTWSVADELKVMASVQAYFQVSHKRVVDNVPLTVEHELNQALSNGIEQALLRRVFKDLADGQADVNSLLREKPDLEVERSGLRKREECLRRIKDKLDLLEPQDALPCEVE